MPGRPRTTLQKLRVLMSGVQGSEMIVNKGAGFLKDGEVILA